MKLMLHINRHELKKGKKGYPWTIHTSKACIRAKSVEIQAPAHAECFPERKSNPKCFVIVQGEAMPKGKGHYVLVGKPVKASMNGSRILTIAQYDRLMGGR